MKRLYLPMVLGAAALMVATSIPAPALSQTEPARTLEVTGHGEVRANPDVAFLELAIETHGATAEEAAGQNADLSRKVMGALRPKLGDSGKIWTGGYTLYPDYDQHQGESKPKITGYRAENSI